ncbi:MAG: porin [Burkholderiales bacterium]|nr:porin [Burkholderiales bacterium]
MNHKLLAAGLFTLATLTSAQAQSTLTFYGIADLALRNVNNQGVGSLQSEVSGSASTSRVGLRGSQVLPDGLSAGFNFEHGLAADSGTEASATKFWDRRAVVMVASKTLGELRLGRDFVPTYTVWTRYDPFSYVGVARSADFFTATPAGPIKSAFAANDNTTVRADNTVQYLMPALGGVEGGLLFAPGEGNDATAGRAKVAGLRLGYAAPGLHVSAATQSSQNSLTTVGKFKDVALGASVDVGPVRLSGAWRQLKYDQSKQTNLMIAALGTFGKHQVKASMVKANMSGQVGATSIEADDASKFGVGYVFNLSKEASMYASLARISNDGAAKFSIPGGRAGLVAGGTSTGYEAGITYRF